MNGALTIIYETPNWVYVVFVGICFYGLKLSKPHSVSLKKLFILPVIIGILAISQILKIDIKFTSISYLVFMAMIGFGVGWLIAGSHKIRIVHSAQLLHMSKSYVPLVLLMLIFVMQYYFQYQLEITTEVNKLGTLKSMYAICISFCIGILFGRVCFFAQKLRKVGQAQID